MEQNLPSSRAATASSEAITESRLAHAMKYRCPICKAPTDSAVHPQFPFCSERCRLFDLGNWASEKYVVSEPVFDEEDHEEPAKPNDNAD
jgi:endogenous inhibitor of DNA gyrase (YacG/DUF329 family)